MCSSNFFGGCLLQSKVFRSMKVSTIVISRWAANYLWLRGLCSFYARSSLLDQGAFGEPSIDATLSTQHREINHCVAVWYLSCQCLEPVGMVTQCSTLPNPRPFREGPLVGSPGHPHIALQFIPKAHLPDAWQPLNVSEGQAQKTMSEITWHTRPREANIVHEAMKPQAQDPVCFNACTSGPQCCPIFVAACLFGLQLTYPNGRCTILWT